MEWQPIETAPTNGCPIWLAYDPDDWTTTVGFYRNGGWVVCGVFYSPNAGKPPHGFGEYLFANPTHWMPLPDPPKDAG